MCSKISTTLPPELRAAFESDDESQFAAALEALSPEQQEALVEQMQSAAQEAGIDLPQPPSGPDMDKVLENFAP